jgi:hypothetical protein
MASIMKEIIINNNISNGNENNGGANELMA